eukprot:9138951-Alexandrium_andersonii.AAC.1
MRVSVHWEEGCFELALSCGVRAGVSGAMALLRCEVCQMPRCICTAKVRHMAALPSARYAPPRGGEHIWLRFE